jgi:hypothetical protein
MKDKVGIYYYPFPDNKRVRMYVREKSGEVEFRMKNEDDRAIWNDHGWVPYDAIQQAQVLYANGVVSIPTGHTTSDRQGAGADDGGVAYSPPLVCGPTHNGHHLRASAGIHRPFACASARPSRRPGDRIHALQGSAGLLVFLFLAWLMGENRTQVSLKLVAAGIGIQLIAGLILLKLPVFRQFFMILNNGVMALEAATTAGTSFVFGYLGGAALPFAEAYPGASFILAFRRCRWFW